MKLKLSGYRRFAELQSLDLNEDLVALVGPNEAGKSSVLDALSTLGGSRKFAPTDATRRLNGATSISGLFFLDPDDRAELAEIRGGPEVTHVSVEMTNDSDSRLWRVEKRPQRDLSPRKRCRELVASLEGDPALSAEYSQDDKWPWDPNLIAQVMSHLDVERETLDESAARSFESLGHRLLALQYPASVDEASEQLATSEEDARRRGHRESTAESLLSLAEIEQEPSPWRQVVDVLQGRLPAFAAFKDADRDLQRSYPVAEVAGSPPAALANLCALAGLDLLEVQQDLAAGHLPHVEKLLEEANRNLKKRFQGTWTQSQVYPRLGTPTDGVLHIYIATEGEEDYTFPEERSDGLRWFIALHAFLASRGTDQPILLVDEAETHLHYDGQADLIDALMSQRIASKVIYTTHSVGCLPPDLGCGIRAILPTEGVERSRIVNSYWSVEPGSDDRVGYTPLLFAMGARLLSLTIPRYGLIVEGPSDAILLPSLLREATGLNRLPYRVVPGLSELAESKVTHLSHHAGRVVCLTDDDEGGRGICLKLRDGGLADVALLDLGQVTPGCTLEDLVSAGVFADAVNSELEIWALGSFRVSSDQLPPVGRWPWLKAEGERDDTSIASLSKSRVAQRIVDAGRLTSSDVQARPRLDATTAELLEHLHRAILEALEIPKGD